MISYYKIDKLKKISNWNIEVEKYTYYTRIFIEMCQEKSFASAK